MPEAALTATARMGAVVVVVVSGGAGSVVAGCVVVEDGAGGVVGAGSDPALQAAARSEVATNTTAAGRMPVRVGPEGDTDAPCPGCAVL